ncbi:MAG: two-component regulator propeller domain-containing protein [Gracilimonas sp.]
MFSKRSFSLLFFRSLLLSIVFFVGFSGYSPVHAQSSKTFSFTNAIDESELPHYAVHHIMQDSFGFMWISTREGICRYDGNNCSIFRNENGPNNRLTSNLIWLSFEDSKSRVWIGSKGAGVGVYNYRTDVFKSFMSNAQDSTTISNNIVTAIFEDEDGVIWIGTDGGGLNRVVEMGNDDFSFQRINLSIDNLSILDIEQDDEGNLWLGTYGQGIIKYDIDSNNSVIFDTNSSPISLSDNFVMSLSKEDSLIWVGTKFGGLTRIHLAKDSVEFFRLDENTEGALPSDFIWDIYIDEEKNKWIGSYGGGLALLESGSREFQIIEDSQNQNSFSDGYIMHITQDRLGQFWVGTDNQGVFKFKQNPVFEQVHNTWKGVQNTSNLVINHMVQVSDRSYWISTNQGLFRADPELNEAEFFDPGFDTSIFYEVAEDQDNVLWIASNLNLYKYDIKTESFSKINVIGRLGKPGTDRLFDIHIDDSNDLWITSDGGLVHYKPKEDKLDLFEHDPEDSSTITGDRLNTIFKQGEEDNIWITTDDKGVNIFDINSKLSSKLELSAYINPKEISRFITEIETDDAGNIWMGSSYQGGYILYQNSTGIDSVTRISSEGGLLSDDIYDFAAFDSNMLIAHKSGFSLIDIEEKGIQTINLPRYLSLSGRGEFYTNNDEIYFYHKNKILRVITENFGSQADPPNIILTGINVYDNEIPVNHFSPTYEKLSLNHTQDFISFSFQVLNFDISRNYLTEYMLEGRDPYWLKGSETESINYTNLTSGEYTFKVRFLNTSDSESTIVVPITIAHPFWETMWFRISLALILALILYSVYKYRMYYLLKEERTRNRIARDLHDDLSATLSSISFFTDAVKKVGNQSNEKSEHFLTLISESATEAKEKINDIIWSIDPSKDDWSIFLKKCKRYAADAFDSRDIDYEIEVGETFKIPVRLELRQNLWLIYKEMVNNLITHSQATKAFISFKETDRIINLEVADNGIGINVEKENNRNGLTNIRERAKLIEAKIKLETSPGTGTKWILSFSK